MIKMNCPHCGHALRIGDEHSGKRGKCKYCNEHIIVGGEQVEPEFGEDKATQRERHRKEREIREMAEAQRQLALARKAEAAKVRAREDRRSRFIFFGIIIFVTGLLAGGGYWFMVSTGKEIPGVYLPADGTAAEEITVPNETLHGVPMPTFGEPAAPLNAPIEWSAAFEGVENESVTCYQIPVRGGYDEVVSDVQLAITRLGWDFTIWMAEEPMPHTELYGEAAGRRAAIRIEKGTDEVLVYAGVHSE